MTHEFAASIREKHISVAGLKQITRWTFVLVIALSGCGKTEPAAKSYAVVPPKPVVVASTNVSVPLPVPSPAAVSRAPILGAHPGEPANIAAVKAAYDNHFERVGQFPHSWQEMIAAKTINAVPMGKNGKPLDFVEYTYYQAGYPAKKP